MSGSLARQEDERSSLPTLVNMLIRAGLSIVFLTSCAQVAESLESPDPAVCKAAISSEVGSQTLTEYGKILPGQEIIIAIGANQTITLLVAGTDLAYDLEVSDERGGVDSSATFDETFVTEDEALSDDCFQAVRVTSQSDATQYLKVINRNGGITAAPLTVSTIE